MYGQKLRKRRNWLRGHLESSLGARSSTCRRLFDDVRMVTTQHRKQLNIKYKKKVQHLVRKYRSQEDQEVDKEIVKKMGSPLI